VHVGDLRTLPEQGGQFPDRGVRVPQLERAGRDDLAGVGELGYLAGRAEGAPGDVVVELVERVRADPRPFPFGVLGDDGPLAGANPGGLAELLPGLQVRGLMGVLGAEEPVADPSSTKWCSVSQTEPSPRPSAQAIWSRTSR
jgi:hypothetical protein